MLLDIDFFKLVNDTYGHPAGNEVLIKIARELISLTKKDAVFRIGGEEFCILLNDIDPVTTLIKAEQIRQSIADIFITHHQKKISVTVSIGVAVAATNSTLSELFKTADVSLYVAKEEGRNCVVYQGKKIQ